jgi:hypothetical protein
VAEADPKYVKEKAEKTRKYGRYHSVVHFTDYKFFSFPSQQ